jgi:hypothetical protein
MRSRVYFVALAVALLLLGAGAATVGCSSSDGAGAAGGDAGEGGLPYPAFMPSVPQAANDFGGHTLRDFTVVPVFFAGDPAAARVPDFLAKYAASPEWTAAAGEYGVGTMTIARPIILNETPPATISDSEIQTWLHQKVDGMPPAWGPSDRMALASMVFAIVYPAGTQVTTPSGTSCTDFIGYHGWSLPLFDDAADGGDAGALDAEAGGADADAKALDPGVLYVVMASCPQDQLTPEQVVTYGLSHELVETATDPYGSNQRAGLAGPSGAYDEMDNDHFVWQDAFHGAEIADLCNVAGSGWAPPSIGYTVARSWSNQAATLYRDPCVPTPPAEPYFNTFIATPESFPLHGYPGEFSTKGIRLRVGETKTFDVNLYSDRQTGPWHVQTFELPIGPNGPGILSVQLDRQSGSNGDTLHLTVYAGSMSKTNTAAIGLISTLGDKTTYWYTAVLLDPVH